MHTFAYVCVCMQTFDLTCDIEYINSLDAENPVAFTWITEALGSIR